MYTKELALSFVPVARATTVRSDVIKIQDWLRLNQISVGQSGSDGDFGAGTESGVKMYQAKVNRPVTGKVEQELWDELVKPLRTALEFRPSAPKFGDAVIEVAKMHLAQKAVELDANRGPWVRTYCQGPDGPDWSWCQGFASTVWAQASETLNVSTPIDLMIYDTNAGRKLWSLYVPTVKNQAKLQGKFIAAERAVMNPNLVIPGSMFFLRGGPHGWSHVGIVIGPAVGGYYPTIEGNTNEAGATNGGAVCLRRRAVSSSDYGLCV